MLGLARAGAGVAGLLAPRLAGRVMGLDAASAGSARFVMRLFATRDLALGLGTLAVSEPGERARWLGMTAAIDAADAAAALTAAARGQIRRSSAYALAALATSAAAYGHAARRG